MEFPERLAQVRKKRQMNQNQLAEQIGIHVSQLRRYEAGTSQPTLDVLRKLALVLHCSTDALIFGEDGRGPSNDLRLQFEAIAAMDDAEKQVAKEVLEGLILRHQAKHWTRRE